MFLNFPEHKLLVNVNSIDSFEILEPTEENGIISHKLVMNFRHLRCVPNPTQSSAYVLFSGDLEKALNIWRTIQDKLDLPENVQTINTINWTPSR